ncbi:MAG: hypothetical protein ACFB2W_02635 [Leptolyngbyaceae cyanobacterium]
MQSVYRNQNFGQASEELTSSASVEQLYLLQALPKLGFENLFANGIFLKFLQYFGDDAVREKTGYGLSPDFFSLILAADPYYRPFYLFASSSSTLYAGQPTRAISLLNQGLEQLEPNQPPDAFLIWRYKGTDELLFLGSSASAQESFQTAADWADVSNYPNSELVAEVSRRMVESLKQNSDNTAVKTNAWLSLLNSALDEASRQRIIEEIRSLGGDISVDSAGKVDIDLPTVD